MSLHLAATGECGSSLCCKETHDLVEQTAPYKQVGHCAGNYHIFIWLKCLIALINKNYKNKNLTN